MTLDPHSETHRLIGALFDTGTIAGLNDGQLLERFAGHRDQGAEVAFAELVRRHGPMVYRICRATLLDEHEAQDAFQATFLVLVHKASTLPARDTLGPWLHAVALRITACARVAAARRRVHEQRYRAMAPSSVENSLCSEDESVLHEEIGRLPNRYRAAVVLCDLEGLTHDAAARQLGWPVGTVKSRQARGRARLRSRLIRRGLAPAVGAVGWETGGTAASASLPAVLAEATVQLALNVGPGTTPMAVLVAAPVVALVEGGLRTMLLSKLRMMVVMLLGTMLVTTGMTVLAFSTLGQQRGPDPRQPDDQGKEPETRPNQQPAVIQVAPSQRVPDRQTPQEELFSLLHAMDARAKEILAIKPGAERKAVIKQAAPDLDRTFGRFLDLAKRHPRSDVAEQALIWLARHTSARPEVRTAREILARDHARSDRLGSVFGPEYCRFHACFWQASEDLLRNALEQNPYVEVRGLAAYWLAGLLKDQAESLSLFALDGPAEARRTLTQLQISADDVEWLLKKDPKQAEDEAVRLYERVIAEFPNIANNDIAWSIVPPRQLGAAAAAPLDELRRLWFGKPAPEIDGVDLDGKPLKLSDYRGKPVILYADAKFPLRSEAPQRYVTKNFLAAARKMEGTPVAFLGLVSGPDRESFKKEVQASGASARFWWDPDEERKPGPLRTAWGALAPDVYVIDPQGVIRYRGLRHIAGVEKAMAKVLIEMGFDKRGEPESK